MRWVLAAVALLFAAGEAAAAPIADPPSTSDLLDPFTAGRTSRARAGSSEPWTPRAAPDLRDPFRGRVGTRVAAAVTRELHDPFARRADVGDGAPRTDLRDPFARAPGPTGRPARSPTDDDLGLKNPFREPSPRPRRVVAADVEATSSDLKNPFARRAAPVKPASPAVAAPLPPLRVPTVRRGPQAPLQRPRSLARPAPAR